MVTHVGALAPASSFFSSLPRFSRLSSTMHRPFAKTLRPYNGTERIQSNSFTPTMTHCTVHWLARTFDCGYGILNSRQP
ncbi:hypothetical protein L484_002281 [Morus notabilis]|uniref:Uncharacterized protein n=1 Tax=Morus notabilis TaxID=981085 RepID=W9R6C8_9ROSA|nr:hypothetical protein L484_002281 [Morus notabilis]